MAALPNHTNGTNMSGYGTTFGGSGADGSSGAGVTSNQAIRVVLVGDKGTGKTSLIVSSLTDSFPDNPVPVLPPTRLLPDMFTEKIPLLLVDTSSRCEGREGGKGVADRVGRRLKNKRGYGRGASERCVGGAKCTCSCQCSRQGGPGPLGRGGGRCMDGWSEL